MSLWKKLFGRDFEESIKVGEDLLRAGNVGDALLELEHALSRSKNAPEERVAYVRRKIAEARDALARAQIDAGTSFLDEGNTERALPCFEAALDIAESEDVKRDIRALVDRLEAQDAREAYEANDDMTDAERFQILSGAWEDERADELESYGDPFRRAFLQLHEGDAAGAAARMAELLEQNPGAVFLHLERGLALRNAGELEEAAAAIRSFLSLMEEERKALERIHDDAYEDEDEGEDEGEDEDQSDDDEDDESEPLAPEARVQAHSALAEIYLELGDAGAAEKELRTLVELLPEKSGPYVHLGSFLRSRDRPDEALQVLEKGREFMGSIQPDMRVVREIGLTHRALGDSKAAIASLKAVVEFQASRDDYNFDPATAIPLAELYEAQGDADRAADLYRHLAAGTHAAGHYLYNKEAGRLLAQLGENGLARKHLTRALELAPDSEARDTVSASLEKLPSDTHRP